MSEVLNMLTELVTERAERGNAQSKHGLAAAISHEVHELATVLDDLMNKRQAAARYYCTVDWFEVAVRDCLEHPL